MGTVVLQGASSGATTLTPTDGVTATLTLPSATGTLLTSTGTIATATNLAGGSNGTIPYQSASGTTQMLAVGTSGQVLQTNGAGAPSWVTPSGGSGRILQIVQGTKTGNGYTISGTFVSTGLYATITPSATSSKIIIIATSHNVYRNSGSGGLQVAIYRGTSGNGSGSNIATVTTGNGGGDFSVSGTVNWLDSPSSTSALTYTIMNLSVNASSLVGWIGELAGTSSILLLEVSA
jgi:hypothetical protein